MPGFRETFRADMVASGCTRRGLLAGAWYFIARYDYSAVLLFRLSCAFHAKGGKVNQMLAMIFWRINTLMNACDMRPQAIVGPGLNLPHPVGVIIGFPVTIGKNAHIHQNVTLGRRVNSTNMDDLAPLIVGDNVNIGCGAVIVGGATIGDNCDIGANSVVAKEVPSNSTAIGVPARVIRRPDPAAEKPVVVAAAPVAASTLVIDNPEQQALFTPAEMEKAALPRHTPIIAKPPVQAEHALHSAAR